MDSKQEILRALRARPQREAGELPDLNDAAIQYDDPPAQFAVALQSVGGNCVRLAHAEQLHEALSAIESFQRAQRIASTVAGVTRANVDIAALERPHLLADLDFFVAAGQVAVAENAAVWVSDLHLRHRAAYFICRNLALVVPIAQVVNNLHEAYAQIEVGHSSFGAFISGPSKTADIEQSLVIGAHGPRSMTVFLVG